VPHTPDERGLLSCPRSLFAALQLTGVWKEISAAKATVCEPRGTGEAFDDAMAAYYAAVADGRGALFLAICRGKACASFIWTGA
jgi:hypothetical protein